MGWAKYDEDIREEVDARIDLLGGYMYGTESLRCYSGNCINSKRTCIKETRIVKVKKNQSHYKYI